ncbi:hypothetical protein C8C99_0295 [Acidovorax sp. 107]|uniref:hypothetical protein n=1 Tax=Acidovorax sp. 107 TaxID=2135638 RepID=UPI000D33BBA1|nr:hypothetical protein [Acidovorax sp. 107]PUA95495.1 hypothetical protein C8C99_0295 [Acidovorax sp. 107]
MTAELARLRRTGYSPVSVFVFVGTPPKSVETGPDVIVVERNPRAIDWRPLIGLHVDVVEVGDQGDLYRETVQCAETGKPRSIGLLCRAGIAGLNAEHEQILARLQRTINAIPH